ncbi:MAG: hypothetical protein HFG54_02725 [Lachnospiraceae bacterium]|jgi:transglutaminase/protease-like cytokinesis protein 3|nr:hypothetical protein [Lachnospiraceae bacterium]
MKKTPKSCRNRLLSAVIPVAFLLTILVSGCFAKNSPVNADSKSSTGDSKNTESTSDINSAYQSSTTNNPDSNRNMEDSTWADTSLEKDGPILPDSFLIGEKIEITDQDGEEISRSIEEMEMTYRAEPGGPEVKSRNWNAYTSELAKKSLSPEEAKFYNRLDELCLRYIQNPALDGVKYEGTQIYYTTDKIHYKDLSLTNEQACNILWWFKYNNPQYYFLNGSVLSSSDYLIPTLYEFASSGETRAKLTNELFDKLDTWIASINSNTDTTLKAELSTNNMLCREFVYDDSLLEEGCQDTWRGQNIYTAIMTGDTVCAGYAQVFCAMMNASGIETVVALSPNHAWNVVHLDDGNYYAMDVCWNDNEHDDNNPYNKYVNVGEITLKATADREESHTYSDKTALWTPVITQNDYSPTA